MIVGGTDAGKQLVPYYNVAERMYPILPDDVEIRGDTPVNTFGLAWYEGINENGLPIFRVRDDIVISQTPYIGFHEAGHAFQAVVCRAIAAREGSDLNEVYNRLRTRYWEVRRFPGTWFEKQLEAIGSCGWSCYPDESWADAFAQTVFGYNTGEWTWNEHGRYVIDVPACAQFFKEIEREALGGIDVTEEEARAIARQEATDAVGRYALAAIETGFDPVKKAFNYHDHGVISADGTPVGGLKTTKPILHDS